MPGARPGAPGVSWAGRDPSPAVPVRLIAVVVDVAVVLGVASVLLGLSWWRGPLLWASFIGLSAATTGARLRRHTRARPLAKGEHPRAENLIEGLAATAGVEAPSILVVPDGSPNAFVSPVGRAVGVTAALLESFSRTELEAVLAHCLMRLSSKRRWALLLASPFGSWAGRLAPPVGVDEDVAALSVTRYPPALAAAVEKASSRSGPLAAFWFVADGPTHVPARRRIDEILDL